MKLGDVCKIYTGGEAPTNHVKGNYPTGEMKYPIWANGREIYGYSDTYKIEEDAVCISSIGANAGDVFYHEGFFTPIIRLKVIIPKETSLNIRYLFHILSVKKMTVKKSSVPNINANEIKGLIIPLPPLSEQERIVSILDRFEALTTDLQSGLPAEIEARRKQYEYYREKLLTFKRKEF